MLLSVPLMLIPFILYNIFMLGLGFSDNGLNEQLFEMTMVSGAQWRLNVGDVFIIIGLVALLIEVLKATRTGPFSVIDHILSLLVFIAFLVEFLLVPDAATDVFFILMMISLIDVIAGFSVSIRSASRDVAIGL